ncbi:MAG: hypothetical protein KatS3mg081_2375 [Gemmatimonadales bacterium]|nr:MAG: hypothetical protein KatS3mg081_2375 [Gemmatimonadales bacterium]
MNPLAPGNQRVGRPVSFVLCGRAGRLFYFGRGRDLKGVPKRAKLFCNGRSQAVRLPKEFRFEGDEVLIRREGDRVILEPVGRRRWPRGYWERLAALARGFEFPDVGPLPAGRERPGLGEW